MCKHLHLVAFYRLYSHLVPLLPRAVAPVRLFAVPRDRDFAARGACFHPPRHAPHAPATRAAARCDDVTLHRPIRNLPTAGATASVAQGEGGDTTATCNFTGGLGTDDTDLPFRSGLSIWRVLAD